MTTLMRTALPGATAGMSVGLNRATHGGSLNGLLIASRWRIVLVVVSIMFTLPAAGAQVLIAASEAVSLSLPSTPGTGVSIDVYNQIGGGREPRPSDINSITPTGSTLSPFIDFPRPGATINVGSSFTTFFQQTTTPPELLRTTPARNFILDITAIIRIDSGLDRTPATPEIDIELGVGSDDGFHLTVGDTFLGSTGDRPFRHSWFPVCFEKPGMYPVRLLFAANAIGQSGLEFWWRTAGTGSAGSIIPQDALFQSMLSCVNNFVFDDLPPGPIDEDVHADRGLRVRLLSGDIQVTDARPLEFIPVSEPFVLGDPDAESTTPGVIEFSFTTAADDGAVIPAVVNEFNMFVINAQTSETQQGALVQAFGINDELLFDGVFSDGSGTQTSVSIIAQSIYRVTVNLGAGKSAAAIDNVCIGQALSAFPDLRVVSVSAEPASVEGGGEAVVTYTVENAGLLAASSGWLDAVYLSGDETLDRAADVRLRVNPANAAPVEPGGSYTRTAAVSIPTDFVGGARHLIVATDEADSIEESSEGSNTGVVLIEVIPTRAPDLADVRVATATLGRFGEAFSVTWEASNIGTGEVAGLWSDQVILSRDAVFSADDVLLGATTIDAALVDAQTGMYQAVLEGTLPLDGRTIEGEWFVLVRADGGNSVAESDETNNLGVLGPIVVSRPPLPNLVVEGVSAPAGVVIGTTAALSWKVRNAGEAAAPGGFDVLVTASDGGASPVNVAVVGVGDAIAPGESVELVADATVLNFSGASIVWEVCADAGAVALETDESDNCASASSVIRRPDLAVQPFTIPSEAVAGSTMRLTYTVVNQGSAPAVPSPPWFDTLAISLDEIVGEDLIVGGSVRVDPVPAGESYQAVVDIRIPETLAGEVRLLAEANRNGDLIESGAGGNRVFSSMTMRILQPDRPNLVVSRVETPPSGLSGAPVDVQWEVTNTGPVAVSGLFTDQIVASRDAVPSADDLVLLDQSDPIGGLAPGETVVRTARVPSPDPPGDFFLLVVADADGAVFEGIDGQENDNVGVSSSAFEVLTFEAMASATLATTGDGQLGVEIQGQTRILGSADPAPNVAVGVVVRNGAFVRRLEAVADGAGVFETMFVPTPREAGEFEVAAGPRIDDMPPATDTFRILRMEAVADSTIPINDNGRAVAAAPVVVFPGAPAERAFTLRNLGGVPLSGIQPTVTGAPPGMEVQVALPSTELPGEAAIRPTVTVQADGVAPGQHRVDVGFTSAEDAQSLPLVMFVSVAEPVARLEAEPADLQSGQLRAEMPVGMTTIVEFRIRNTGGTETGPINVELPEAPWLLSGNELPLESLPPGGEATVILVLMPAETLPLGPFTGTMVLSAANARLAVPFVFEATSIGEGALRVRVTDEFSYYNVPEPDPLTPTGPMVAGAEVVVSDAVDGGVVAAGLTGADGAFEVAGLPAGFYRVEVAAPEHGAFRGAVRVLGGQSTEIEAFLPRQLVSYEWEVIPIEIEERFEITVTPRFQSSLPAPVIVLEPSRVDLGAIEGDATQIDFTVTNHGLITANDVRLRLPERAGDFDVIPLVDEIGDLPGCTDPNNPSGPCRVTVPVLFVRNPQATEAVNDCFDVRYELSYILVCGVPFEFRTPGSLFDSRGCVRRTPTTVTTTGGGGGGGSSRPRVTDPQSPVPLQLLPCDECIFNCARTAVDIFLPIPGCALDVVRCQVDIRTMSPGERVDSIDDILMCHLDTAQCLLEFVKELGKSAEKKNPYSIGCSLLRDCSCLDILGFDVPCSPSELIAQAPNIINTIAGNTLNNNLLSIDLNADGRVDTADLARLLGSMGSHSARTDLNRDGVTNVEDVSEALERWDEETGGTNENGVDDAASGSSPLDPTLQAFITQYAGLLGIGGAQPYILGDPAWLLIDPVETDVLHAWVQRYLDMIQIGSDGDDAITDAERQALMQQPRPSTIGAGLVDAAVERWNNSVDLWAQGVLNNEDLPPGADPNFIAFDDLELMQAAVLAADEEARQRGFSGLIEGFQFAAQTLIADRTNREDTCGEVVVEISQTATLTRSAFRASLNVQNSAGASLEGFTVALFLTDEFGEPAGALFAGADTPALSGLNAIDGSQPLPAGQSMSSTWTLIPRDEAAPTSATTYFVGGRMSYVFQGSVVEIPLFPSPIFVFPNPALEIDYFLETRVFADDPFTPEIEPSIPYSLGALVNNVGGGLAKNLVITSSQPRIVSNDNGIVVDFDIIGTQVGLGEVSPSLTVEFGDLAAGQTAVGRWLMTSTLRGEFRAFDASFRHISEFDDPSLSVLKSVEIFPLAHMVLDERSPAVDDLPDFLTDDFPDPMDLPDSVHLSDGRVETVTALVGLSAVAVDQSEQTATVQATAPDDWVYLRVNDPFDGARPLIGVDRADGAAVRMDLNAWQTERVVRPFGQPVRDERFIHIFDRGGPGLYTLRFGEDGLAPSVTTWQGVLSHSDPPVEVPLTLPVVGPLTSEPRAGGVRQLLVTFDEPIDPSTFTATSVFVEEVDANGDRVEGVAVATNVRTGDRVGVIDFAQPLLTPGRYCVQLAGVADRAGNPLRGDGATLRFAVLPADATGDLRVNNTDVGGVMSLVGIDPIDPNDLFHVRSDVDQDGAITMADVNMVLAARGADLRSLRDPCFLPISSPTTEPDQRALTPTATPTIFTSGVTSSAGAAMRGRDTPLGVEPAAAEAPASVVPSGDTPGGGESLGEQAAGAEAPAARERRLRLDPDRIALDAGPGDADTAPAGEGPPVWRVVSSGGDLAGVMERAAREGVRSAPVFVDALTDQVVILDESSGFMAVRAADPTLVEAALSSMGVPLVADRVFATGLGLASLPELFQAPAERASLEAALGRFGVATLPVYRIGSSLGVIPDGRVRVALVDGAGVDTAESRLEQMNATVTREAGPAGAPPSLTVGVGAGGAMQTLVELSRLGAVASVAVDVLMIPGADAPAPGDTTPDLTGDGVLDTADVLALIGRLGADGGPGDLNADGVVDSADLKLLITRLNRVPAGSAPLDSQPQRENP